MASVPDGVKYKSGQRPCSQVSGVSSHLLPLENGTPAVLTLDLADSPHMSLKQEFTAGGEAQVGMSVHIYCFCFAYGHRTNFSENSV